MNQPRVAQIRTKLTEAFAPQRLDIVDESHKHAGHEGARGGGGHFNVMIVAEAFAGQTLIQRHRMIYTALGEELKQAIHALSIKAYTPAEF
ncbi:MAG: BolA family transcriptional regulator [Gammaproteobacteria bacterium]|nr:BolA family transcriptional regulator [Gammaproteobacteria bacterium]